jgi:hypothetical protein
MLVAAGYASLDIRLSRTVTLAKGRSEARAFTFGLDAFNLTNRVKLWRLRRDNRLAVVPAAGECSRAAAVAILGSVQKLIADRRAYGTTVRGAGTCVTVTITPPRIGAGSNVKRSRP